MSSCNEVSRARNLLGTVVEICVEGLDLTLLHAAADAAFSTIEKVHRLMSFHECESDLSNLNSHAHKETVEVHPWTYEVLSTALDLSRRTGGVFDVTVGDLLIEWNLLPSSDGSEVKRTGTYQDILLLPENRVRFSSPLTIDLGGIAKGFAVDKAIETLRSHGVPSGIVNAGGDLYVFGDPERNISLRVPDAPGRFVSLKSLHEEALATSSPAQSQVQWNGKTVSPLIDGSTETPVIGNVSISVRAPRCIIADGLTKIITRADRNWAPLLQEFQASAIKIEGGEIFTMGLLS